MASEISETANAFAETACKLLIEFTARLVTQKQEVVKILEQFHGPRAGKVDSSYLRQRYSNEMHEFSESREAFEKLIRKTSQWVEHGKSPQPNLELELEVRLANFETMLRSMEHFFDTNRL